MQEILWDNSEKAKIKLYENQKDDFHIIPQWNSNIKFWAIIKNSEITFNFDLENEDSILECYFLLPAIKDQNTHLNIQTNFRAKNTKVWITVIALASDKASTTLNGNLHIEKNIQDVEAKLYEETLLIWNANYISLIPWLRVDSPNVIASHWAKIQRISPDRIFYMQSRWLDQNNAINMIINSYSEQIIDKLELDETQKSEFYSMIN
jgi:Fe-S cluster assembly protein SufD